MVVRGRVGVRDFLFDVESQPSAECVREIVTRSYGEVHCIIGILSEVVARIELVGIEDIFIDEKTISKGKTRAVA